MRRIDALLHVVAPGTRTGWLAGVCLWALAGFCATAGHADPPDEGGGELVSLEAFVEGIVAARREEHVLPGVAVSIVKDGRIVLLKGYGFADLEAGVPVDPSRTLFQIGSVSKTFAALAVMQQVERGALDLEADVNDYLDDFSIPATFEEPVTLRALLSHRAGFEDAVYGHLIVDDPEEVMGLGEYLATRMPERVRLPGVASSYSNHGIALAGYLVERVTGTDYPTYVQENILTPLEMRHSTLREPLGAGHPAAMRPELERLLARGYRKGRHGRPEAQPHPFVGQIAPSGGVLSTGEDMARYMLAQLNQDEYRGRRLLEPATSRAIRQRLYQDRPLAIDVAHATFDGIMHGHAFRAHSGGSTTFKSSMTLFPDLGLGVFAVVNSDDGGSSLADELPQLIVQRYFPVPEVEPPVPPPDFAERAGRYTGTYMPTLRSYTQLEKLFALGTREVTADAEGYLVIDGIYRFVEVAPDVFQRVGAALRGVGKLPIDVLYFREAGDGEQMFFTLPASDYERISFLESPAFLVLAATVAVLLAMTMLLSAWRRSAGPESSAGLARLAGGVATATAFVLVVLLFLVLRLVVGGADQVAALYNWPGRLMPVLYVVLGLGTLTALLMVLMPVVWTKSRWSSLRRLHYTAFALACCALLVAFQEWNLIGFNYFR